MEYPVLQHYSTDILFLRQWKECDISDYITLHQKETFEQGQQ